MFRSYLRQLAARPVASSYTSLLVLLSSSAFADAAPKHFEDSGYSMNIGFDTPMSTIAGLTDWAKEINHVYGITAWITAAIFFVVAIPVIVAIYKFRVKPGDSDDIPPKQVHGNVLLELTWTIGPVILLLFIAVPTWQVIFRQYREPAKDALIVEVVGHQWWWEFRYPSLGITTANELYLPENKEVLFQISSADVIHSFWIPQFGGKVDALPRPKGEFNTMIMVTPPVPDANKVGGLLYQGQCVELCGLSHALMRFNVSLRTQDEFDRWAKAYNNAPVVATEAQRKGEQVFNQCMGCHTISGTVSATVPGDKIGPNLTNFGSRSYLGAGTRRNTSENLAEWIDNPEAIKPGSLMPKLGLSKEDIAAVSAYIRQSTAKSF